MGLTGARVAEPFDRLDPLSPAALRRWWTARVRRVLEIAVAELPSIAIDSPRRASTWQSFRSARRSRAAADLSQAGHAGLAEPAGSHRLGIERSVDRNGRRDVDGQLGNHRHDISHHQPAVATGAGQVVGSGALVGGLSDPARVRDLGAPPGTATRPSSRISPSFSRRSAWSSPGPTCRVTPIASSMRCAASVRATWRCSCRWCSRFSTAARARPRAASALRRRRSLLVTGAPITPGMGRHLREVTGVRAHLGSRGRNGERAGDVVRREARAPRRRPTPATSKRSIRATRRSSRRGSADRWCTAS